MLVSTAASCRDTLAVFKAHPACTGTAHGQQAMPNKILIVEDTDEIREALVIALTEEGFRVAAAATGEEAFDELSGFDPDIVLLDLHLPGMSGVDILKEMRQTVSVPILMYTSYGMEDEVREAIDAGATDYVLKDSGIEELFRRVNRHMALYRELPTEVTSFKPGAKPLILYVGEDIAVMRAVSDTAQRISGEASRVTTAEVAMYRMGTRHPSLIVMDFNLRESAGRSIVEMFARGGVTPRIPVILVADDASPRMRESAVEDRVDAVYVKPLSEIELERTVRKLLRAARNSTAA